jgi:hypothetical protein
MTDIGDVEDGFIYSYSVTMSLSNIMFFLKMSEQGTSFKLIYGFTL